MKPDKNSILGLTNEIGDMLGKSPLPDLSPIHIRVATMKRYLLAHVELPMMFLGTSYPFTVSVFGKIIEWEGFKKIDGFCVEHDGVNIEKMLDSRLLDEIANDILQGHYE